MYGLGAVCGVFSCCLDGNFVCIRSLGSLLPPLCSFLCFFLHFPTKLMSRLL